MKIAIHQPQYMAWVGYFNKMASADLFVLLDDVQYKKNEWQHRNRIRGADGWQWLSVPGTFKFGQKINEVRIRSDEDWESKHLRSLEMCYGRAPFFRTAIESLQAYYHIKRTTMSEVTIDSVRLLSSLLGVTTPIEISSHFNFSGVSTQRLVNICKHFNATTYLAGAGGHDYMDVSLFEREGIAVEFQSFKCPVYRQHWSRSTEEFIPGLSGLDLLFNCGPQSYNILMGTP